MTLMKMRPVKADNIETRFRRGWVPVLGRIFAFYGIVGGFNDDYANDAI